MTTTLPPGRRLAWRNRRVIAERMHWPDGAVEDCEAVERQHPSWWPWWHEGGTLWRPKRGLYARPWRVNRDDKALFGETPEELSHAIEAWVPPNPWRILRPPDD